MYVCMYMRRIAREIRYDKRKGEKQWDNQNTDT